MYHPELEIKDTTESNISASYLDLLLSIGRDRQLHTSLHDKTDDFNFHMTFLSDNSSYTQGLAPLMNVLFWGRCDFPISFSDMDM